MYYIFSAMWQTRFAMSLNSKVWLDLYCMMSLLLRPISANGLTNLTGSSFSPWSLGTSVQRAQSRLRLKHSARPSKTLAWKNASTTASNVTSFASQDTFCLDPPYPIVDPTPGPSKSPIPDQSPPVESAPHRCPSTPPQPVTVPTAPVINVSVLAPGELDLLQALADATSTPGELLCIARALDFDVSTVEEYLA